MEPIKNLSEIVKNKKLRKQLTFESHFMFFHIYFRHYIEYDTAEFQKEMFALTENPTAKNIVIVAFRGSGKSTIMNTSLPIWSILGKPQCKHVVIVGLTQDQAKRHLKNIKQELEDNELLSKDLGPFKEIENDWSAYTLEIPDLGARITAVSIDQSIRGIRHGAHRPDLIICDDVEDLNSTKTLESRDKVDEVITSEIIPAGTPKTRLVVIGNLLHEDSFIMRLRKRIVNKEFDGEFRAYPLLNEKEDCSWPGKFPDEESILHEKRRIGKESSWQREYMLTIVTDSDRVIFPEWIRTYHTLPEKDKRTNEFRGMFTGIDLAISQNDKADYTAMVTAQVHGYKDKMKIYIMPNPINAHLTFNHILGVAKQIHDEHGAKLIVEDVQFQKAAIQELEAAGCDVEGFIPKGDKRARLSLISHYFEKGQILFPEHGCEKLIQQITNFGLERHDDLMDALSMLISHASQGKELSYCLMFLDYNGGSSTHYKDRSVYSDRYGNERVVYD